MSKARRVNKLVCDTDESHVIKHFIQDKSGKLKLHSKGRIPAKLQKAEDKILENKAKYIYKKMKKDPMFFTLYFYLIYNLQFLLYGKYCLLVQIVIYTAINIT